MRIGLGCSTGENMGTKLDYAALVHITRQVMERGGKGARFYVSPYGRVSVHGADAEQMVRGIPGEIVSDDIDAITVEFDGITFQGFKEVSA
jgi:hypothetical protein